MTRRPIPPTEFPPDRPYTAEPPPDSRPPPREAPPDPPRRRWALRLFLGAGALLVLALLGLEAWRFVTGLLERSLLLGGLLAVLIVATAAGGLAIVLKELRDIARLARLQAFRDTATRLMASEMHGEAEGLLGRVETMYRRRDDLAPLLDEHASRKSDALADGERLALFARTVLEPIDRRARREVVRAARDVGGLTAISPLGLLDAIVVLAHTFTMIRRIATLYGFRPGPAAMVSLARRTLRNVLYAGVAEVVSDAAVESTGASIAGVFSAKAAQGIVNGLLCARLGLAAMEQCRPLPFTDRDRPRLRHIRAELLD
jgi:putative membrane protein